MIDRDPTYKSQNPLRVLLIDNQGSDGPERIKTRLLPDHKVDIVKAWKLNPHHYNDHDLVVLSGGSRARANTPETTYDEELELIKKVVVPVFGICLGMQLIVRAYEGEIQRLEERRSGLLEVQTSDDNPLTQGVGPITVYEGHRWAVKSPPPSLQAIGSSVDGVEIIRHLEKPIAGVQFHPERDGDYPTQGKVIFDRFMEQLVLK